MKPANITHGDAKALADLMYATPPDDRETEAWIAIDFARDAHRHIIEHGEYSKGDGTISSAVYSFDRPPPPEAMDPDYLRCFAKAYKILAELCE